MPRSLLRADLLRVLNGTVAAVSGREKDTARFVWRCPRGVVPYCDCATCQEKRTTAEFTCHICHYNGPPQVLSCKCIDQGCKGLAEGRKGFGCGHGSYTCPFCMEGFADAWVIIRKIRELVQ
jgi:hypothetical protein